MLTKGLLGVALLLPPVVGGVVARLMAQQQGGLTLETAQVISIVSALLAIMGGAFAWVGKGLLKAKDDQIAAEKANGQVQLAAKDVQITALTAEIAAQRLANSDKDVRIADHSTQVIELLRTTVQTATSASEAQTVALHALRESLVTGVQATSREHTALLEALQMIGGALEWKAGEADGPGHKKGAR